MESQKCNLPEKESNSRFVIEEISELILSLIPEDNPESLDSLESELTSRLTGTPATIRQE